MPDSRISTSLIGLDARPGDFATGLLETRPPSAVHVVLGECDASSPRVRRAARTAWRAYVTEPPPEPPRRKLKLTTEHFTPTRKRPQQLALF